MVHPSYVPVAYHPVIELVPSLVATYQPDIVLHIGLASGRNYFAVEQTAPKSGYQWIQDVDNKTFTIAEQNSAWSDQPSVLSTNLDLHAAVALWQNSTASITWPPANSSPSKSHSKAGKPVDIRLLESFVGATTDDVMSAEDVRWSDNVGIYLCAFIYYADMVEMSKSGKDKKRNVAFLHVPDMNTTEEVAMGVEIVIDLVQALVQTWRGA
jgi:pyroglutamyl-peptidase